MKRLLLFLSISILIQPALAQLTITQSDFLALVGKSKTRSSFLSTDQTAVATLIAKTGVGQNWDLSGINFTSQGSTTNEIVAGTSGAVGAEDPAFATATHYFKSSSSANPDSVGYSFITIAADAVHALGFAYDSSGKVFKSYYTPPTKIYQLPLAFGVQWTSNYALTFSYQPGFSVDVMSSYEVDAEGTIKLPQGQTKEVLRLKQTGIRSLGGFGDTTVIYLFIGKTDREAASIIAPKPSPFPGVPGVPGSITYYVGGGGSTEVTVAPQQISPADGAVISGPEATLEWGTVANAATYRVQVAATVDFQTVLQDNSPTGTTITHALAAGVYFWRVAGVSNGEQAGPWSSVRSFTMTPLAVEKDEQSHVRIVPNPATEYVMVSNIEGEYQTYELHDMLGRTVRSDKIITSEKSMTFDLHALLPGCYWLLLKGADGELATSKIIVK